MINLSYASMAIVFWFVLLNDTTASRRAMAGAVEMAGLGPFGLLWVGLWSFMMTASNYKVLDEGENTPWCFLYWIINGGLLFLHWWFAPEIYAWTKKTPPAKAVDAPAAEEPVEDETEPAANDDAFEW